MTKVKICGITNLEDALMATELGADMLGFNFYEKSPRYLEPLAAKEIIDRLPNRILKVGIFVGETIDQVLEIERMSGIRALQLHGGESPRYVSDLMRRTGAEIIKAFQVRVGFSPHEVLNFGPVTVLLDAFSPNEFGGTGAVFDWNTALLVKPLVGNLFLAGGLNDENVGEAVEIVRPYAVDVASGVESSPGKKEPMKLEAFIRNAKNG
jgi:phosphoribosylanthranilate isomerase